MWIEFVLIFVLILVNAFFAAAEIAVVTTRRSRVKQMIEEGHRNAEVLERLKEKPDRFLATIQIGITMVGAFAGAIGGAGAVETIKPLLEGLQIPVVSRFSGGISLALIALLITYFSIVVGELIPKSLALTYPESIGLITAPVIDKLSKVASVFVKILTASTNVVLRPFGKRAFSERGYISEEEIKMLLEEGKERGVFETEEKELIHSVFEFTDTFVREVMIPATQMITIRLDMSAEGAAKVIAEEKFSRYPVIGKDLNDVRGILYAKDFYNILSRAGRVEINKIVRPAFYIPETMKISILLREMQRRRVHMAIVIDEYGGVSGLVTLEDLLEEIVGEIRDEYDVESPVIHLSDGSMIIDASISVRDLIDDYGIEIPVSPEYETLGGFIVTQLQRIPEKGDTIDLNGKALRVIEMVARRIAKVKLEKIEAEVEQE
jgi:putative hemolysin